MAQEQKYLSTCNFLSLLALQARALDSSPPTIFLVILKQVNFWRMKRQNYKLQLYFVDCVARVHSLQMATLHVIKIHHDQRSFHN